MQTDGIVVEQVTRVFGGLRAVDATSFTLKPGETLAVVGPNGAGKSTLVQMISGVERIDSGSIHIDGIRTDGLQPDRIARLGVGGASRHRGCSRALPSGTACWWVRSGG